MPTHMKEQESCCEVSGKDPAGSDTPETIELNEVASDRLVGGLMNFDWLAAQVSERHLMIGA